jgi:glycosyltransferase involved in cell wall biosynthesis
MANTDNVAPLLTIGLPVYNGAEYLRSALDSLLAQDFEDFRLVISDNASTDETSSIAREYAGRDMRVRYERFSSNVGAWPNFSHVYASGRDTKYFMWASDHDLWAPTLVGRCLHRLEADSSVVIAYPQTQYIDPRGQLIDTPEPAVDTVGLSTVERLERILTDYPICAMMGVYRRSALDRLNSSYGIGLYGPLSHPTPDFILVMRMANLGGFAVVPERLYFNRQFRHIRWTEDAKVKQLAPERTARFHRWALVRDLARLVREGDLTPLERVRLARAIFGKRIWPYRRGLLYELDVFHLYGRAKAWYADHTAGSLDLNDNQRKRDC